MLSLTKEQSVVFDFIVKFCDEKGYSPTYQEIADGLGYKSLATVHKHVLNLERKGRLLRSIQSRRSLTPVKKSATQDRFVIENPDRIWDTLLRCYWIKE